MFESNLKLISHDTFFLVETQRRVDAAFVTSIKVPIFCKRKVEIIQFHGKPCKAALTAVEIDLKIWKQAKLGEITEKLEFTFQRL